MRGSAPELVRVAVIGGGLCGLTTVFELIRRTWIDAVPLEIRLYEASGRFGGSICTENRDGFVLEHGPDSLSITQPATLQLALEIGLRDELIAAHVERGLDVWWEGALHPVPPGLLHWGGRRRALLRNPLLGPRAKLRIGTERLVPRRLGRSDESIASFVARRFGRQMLDRVGDPLLAGAYFGDPEELSVDWAFPELVKMERRSGSVAKGCHKFYSPHGDPAGGPVFPGVPTKLLRSPILSFRGGMQVLVDALAAAIRKSDPEALRLSSKVTKLRPAGDPLGAAAYEVGTADGERWTADLCVLAVNGETAAKLTSRFAPEVAEELRAVPHSSSLSVHFGYERRALNGVPETTGCLVPDGQGRPSLACTLVHSRFDYRVPPHAGLAHLQLGGARRAEVLELDDGAVLRLARAEAEALLGIRAQPLFADIRRRRQAHPQYLVNHGHHLDAVDRELAHHSGLLIAGKALYGAALADVVSSGRSTARTISDQAHTRLSLGRPLN